MAMMDAIEIDEFHERGRGYWKRTERERELQDRFDRVAQEPLGML